MEIGVVVADAALSESLHTEIVERGHEAIGFKSLREALGARPKLVFVEWYADADLAALLRGLKQAAASAQRVSVVVFVPAGRFTMARRMRAAGAVDVLFTPADIEEIGAEIEGYCGEERPGEGVDPERLRKVIGENLVGESAVFRKCIEEVRVAACCDANVLVLGPTGTGKEMVAQAVHALSQRAGKAYVAVNCAAVPQHLLESELFGHVKGAFTGAREDRDGRFKVVGGGTLLLDEIGDMDPALQAKLLRAIEQRVFQRLGSNKDISFNARLICTTSVDLDHAVAEGTFRRDLLGRIDQFRITLPPLCERRVDIPILVRHFVRKRAPERQVEVSRSAMVILEEYDFPENVRELENAILGALARSLPDNLILPRHLPAKITGSPGTKGRQTGQAVDIPEGLSYKEARDYACQAVDRLLLPKILEANEGTISRAADEADIDRTTFANRLREATETEGAEID